MYEFHRALVIVSMCKLHLCCTVKPTKHQYRLSDVLDPFVIVALFASSRKLNSKSSGVGQSKLLRSSNNVNYRAMSSLEASGASEVLLEVPVLTVGECYEARTSTEKVSTHALFSMHIHN